MNMRQHENEPIVVTRDVKAVIIPAGVEIKLRKDSSGYITQALGGSFTVYVEGNLFRIAGEDADAIGKEPVRPPELPPNATEDDVRALVWQQMRCCFDPEIPINVVDLGLIYSCEIEPLPSGGRKVAVRMTLTAPGCGMGDVLVADIKEKVRVVPTIEEVDVDLVFDPPWDRHMMSEAARLESGLM
jgi:probable FeS assembly SUF system protein SufT